MALRIRATRPSGIRRCGERHTTEPRVFRDSHFTVDQIEQMRDDPSLVVEDVADSELEKDDGDRVDEDELAELGQRRTPHRPLKLERPKAGSQAGGESGSGAVATPSTGSNSGSGQSDAPAAPAAGALGETGTTNGEGTAAKDSITEGQTTTKPGDKPASTKKP